MVIIAGNVGQVNERQVNTSNGQKTVLDVSVADNIRVNNERKTNWYRFSLWDKYAETMAKYIKKGTIIEVSGELDIREYEGKNGKGYSLEIIQPAVKLLGGNKNDGNSQSDSNNSYSTNANDDDGFMNVPDGLDEELPFA